MKKLLVLLLLGTLVVLGFWFARDNPEVVAPTSEIPEPTLPPQKPEPEPSTVIGTSREGRPIWQHTFGTGSTTILFVGGMHGGYEWNSTLLAYEMIDELSTNALPLPETIRVVIIPSLNPDGLYAATGLEGKFVASDVTGSEMHKTGAGRFNANQVDLNRNFDCKWQATSTWRNQVVSAGTAPFSESEAIALRSLVEKISPVAVIFWHSQANTVYASECEEGILPDTLSLMELYAQAAGYNTVEKFDAYPITGDAEGWLASLGIPAITVELETRTDPEWDRNRAGILALFSWYAKE